MCTLKNLFYYFFSFMLLVHKCKINKSKTFLCEWAKMTIKNVNKICCIKIHSIWDGRCCYASHFDESMTIINLTFDLLQFIFINKSKWTKISEEHLSKLIQLAHSAFLILKKKLENSLLMSWGGGLEAFS